MSHYRRMFVPGGTYFFTVVNHGRDSWFADDIHIASLRDALRRVRGSRPFAIDAIVVLPDHLHCIWRLPDGDADYPAR